MTQSHSTRSLRIGVIETGNIPEEVATKYLDYPGMVASWLGPVMPDAQFGAVRVVNDARLGHPADYDGYVITGSRHGAYDPLPWIAPTEHFIRECGRRRIPIFGICFGHQIIAQAYGARVEKSDRGWGVGSQRYVMDADEHVDADIAVHVFHQDQVLEVPDGAKLIGKNDFCAIGALRYDCAALSVQFHPEFSDGYMSTLLDIRGNTILSPDITARARQSLSDEPNNAHVAQWVANFFHTSVEGSVPNSEEPLASSISA